MNSQLTHAPTYFALILSGGEARRMQGTEKGLVSFKGKAMIDWVMDANSQASHTSISCNRQISDYQSRLHHYQSENSKVRERSLVESTELADLLKKLPSCIEDRDFADKSGPVAGILSYFLYWRELIESLKHTNTKPPNNQNAPLEALLKTPVVVSSCDMVLLDQAIIVHLVDLWSKNPSNCVYALCNQQHCYLPFVVKLGSAINLAGQWLENSSDYSTRQFSIKQWLAELNAQVMPINNPEWYSRFMSINTFEQLKALESTQ